jgi:hypothetical protein
MRAIPPELFIQQQEAHNLGLVTLNPSLNAAIFDRMLASRCELGVFTIRHGEWIV